MTRIWPAEVAANLDLGSLDKDVLSAHEIGEAASKVAVMSKVRSVLVDAQRKFANSGSGAVLDGTGHRHRGLP